MDPTTTPPDEGLAGLTHEEAAARLAAEGPNEIAHSRSREAWRIIAEVLREPMIVLLVLAVLVYLSIGSREEAALLSLGVVCVAAITVYQERRAERALASLRELASPRARVVRSGEPRSVPAREVVRGDLVRLAEGDRVPADGVLLRASFLEADESMLTGESVPVAKLAESSAPLSCEEEPSSVARLPGPESRDRVHAGTLVVRGEGSARIVATGSATAMGRIGTSLAGISSSRTPLQAEVRRLVRMMALFAIVVSGLLSALYAWRMQDYVVGALAGIAAAMSLLPEEFPIVLTLFLALGARRLSRVRVLTRHGPAIETLGAANVLCVDKTGTLTRNQMAIAALYTPSAGACELSPSTTARTLTSSSACLEVVRVGMWASRTTAHDPMDLAFFRCWRDQGRQESRSEDDLLRVYPLTPARMALVHAWRRGDSGTVELTCKGALESVLDMVQPPLPEQALAEIVEMSRRWSSQGLRVLGVARAEWRGALPDRAEQLALQFVGLVGLRDPLRPEVPDAVAAAQRAGIRVVLITGDSGETAMAIAASAGIAHADEAMLGQELGGIDTAAVASRCERSAVFARVVPEQKLQLVRALQASSHVVAMTGDGVNDAPALRAADIGIAMGGRGTDVAREAADLVLTDDRFSSIIDAIRLGRRIYDNIQKSMAYLVAIHFAIAALALWPVLVGGPLVLLPIHIVFLELVIDPASSIAFEVEPPERDLMSRPPRAHGARIFCARVFLICALQGLTLGGASIAVYQAAAYRGAAPEVARALVFSTILAGNLSLIAINRSWTRPLLSGDRAWNRPALWMTGAAAVVLAAALYWPALHPLFGFAQPALAELVVALGAGSLSLLWFEWLKRRRPAWLRAPSRA